MHTRLAVRTSRHSEMIDITEKVAAFVTASGCKQGTVTVFVPHTTAAVTINENADPDVVHDMLAALDKAVPWREDFYEHSEGNSAAHLKSSLVGCSITVPIDGGKMMLGTWQAIYFCEFDGPRNREVVFSA